MNPIVVSILAFVCVFGGALIGMALRSVLPKDHFSEETKDVVKLGIGLIATMTALILGLVTASSKNSFDQQEDAITKGSAEVLMLDRVLAHYGPETKETREHLKDAVAHRLDTTWPKGGASYTLVDSPDTTRAAESIELGIRSLAPTNDDQRWLKSRAQQIGAEILQSRLLVFVGVNNAIPTALLVVLVAWLSIIFASFGLFAPRNATVMAVLLVCALSVAASIFLILEMKHSFAGVMRVSDAPMRYALSQLGK